MQEKLNKCTTNKEDAVKVVQQSFVQEFEENVKNRKSDIICLAYYQGIQQGCAQKFNKKRQFVSMVLKFNVSKSTIMFKIALNKLIDNYLAIKNSSLSLHYFKKHWKMIIEICKEKRQ